MLLDRMKLLQSGILFLGGMFLYFSYSEYIEPSILLVPFVGMILFMLEEGVPILGEAVQNDETQELKSTIHCWYTSNYLQDRDDVSEASSATFSSSTDSYFDSSESDSEVDDNLSKDRDISKDFDGVNSLEKQLPHIVVNIS